MGLIVETYCKRVAPSSNGEVTSKGALKQRIQFSGYSGDKHLVHAFQDQGLYHFFRWFLCHWCGYISVKATYQGQEKGWLINKKSFERRFADQKGSEIWNKVFPVQKTDEEVEILFESGVRSGHDLEMAAANFLTHVRDRTFQKNGMDLSEKDAANIVHYIRKNQAAWERKGYTGAFLHRSKTGLARSLTIMKDGTIFIHFNRKNMDRILGEGDYNRSTLAYDFYSGEMYARTTTKNAEAVNKIRRAQKNFSTLMKLPGFVKLYQVIVYTGKRGQERIETIQQRYESSLFDLLKVHHEFTLQQKKSITMQLVSALRAMHREFITHGDLHAGNVLLRFPGGDVEVGISDFETVAQHPFEKNSRRSLSNDEEGVAWDGYVSARREDISHMQQTLRSLWKGVPSMTAWIDSLYASSITPKVLDSLQKTFAQIEEILPKTGEEIA